MHVLYPIVAVLYVLLSLASLVLLVQIMRHKRTFRNFTQYRENVVVVSVLATYSLIRSLVLFLQVFNVVERNVSNPTTNFFDSFAGLFFALLQLAVMLRWSHRARELAAHFGSAFRAGTVAIFISASLLFVSSMLSTLFIIHWDAFSTKFYLTVCTLSWATVYIYNGTAVMLITLYLHLHFTTASATGISAKRRILLVAFIFWVMCVVRGAGDIVYVATTDGAVSTPASDSWAAPAILVVEIICIALIFSIMGREHILAAVAQAASLAALPGGAAAAPSAIDVQHSDDEESYLKITQNDR